MNAEGSLILGNGEQLALVEEDAHGLPPSAYERHESAGRFTGDRIFSGNPKLYHAIAALLGRAVPYREISEICSVSVNTVCAVAHREGVPIETLRERIGRLGLDVAGLTMEAIRDLLADPDARTKITAKDLAIIHGIAAQNAQLFLGGATARIESIERADPPGHADYLALIRDAIDVTAIGSHVENPPAKGPVSLAAPTAILPISPPAIVSPADLSPPVN